MERREQEMGIRLPAAVRDWYARFGNTSLPDYVEESPLHKFRQIGADCLTAAVGTNHQWLHVAVDHCGGWTMSVPLNGEEDPPVIHDVQYTPSLVSYKFSAYLFDLVVLTRFDMLSVGRERYVVEAACDLPAAAEHQQLQTLFNVGPRTQQRDIDLAGKPLQTHHYPLQDWSDDNWRYFRNDSVFWLRSGTSTKTGEQQSLWYFVAGSLPSLRSTLHDVWHIGSLAHTVRPCSGPHQQACASLLSELRS